MRRSTIIRVIAVGGALAALGLGIGGWLYLRTTNVAVLNPAGHIAQRQQELLLFATLLSLIVIVPVFTLLFVFAWRYRASNTKATYKPDWDHNNWYEAIWWLVPSILILILSVVTWQSSHELDPYKKIQSNARPLSIQVVALNWKWLFIYPEQNVATVNYLQVPVDRPLEFTITSDATMNSFWVPQLGGQIYAMTGMSTKLHLIADKPGAYDGVSANISGEGFSRMNFKVNATSQGDFDSWVGLARQSSNVRLSSHQYAQLAKPTQGYAPTTYSAVDSGLYETVVMKYMAAAPPTGQQSTSANHTHDHHTMPMSDMNHGGMQ